MGVGQSCNLHRFATAQGAREKSLERGGRESFRYCGEEHSQQREQPVENPKVGAYLACFRHSRSMPLEEHVS